jgi:hypothetical protein
VRLVEGLGVSIRRHVGVPGAGDTLKAADMDTVGVRSEDLKGRKKMRS